MSVLGEKAFLANRKEDMIEAILACNTVEELVKKAKKPVSNFPLRRQKNFSMLYTIRILIRKN